MQEMDFNRLMMMQEEEVRVQGTWIPGTPAKPTPIRPQPISNDRQVSQPGLPYWVNSVGNPTEFYQEIPQTVTSTGVMNSSFNSMGYVNQNRGNGNTLQTGMVGSDKGPDNIVDCLSSTISDWSDIGFAELLALSETASGAAAVLTSTGSNHAASNPRFPVSSSQINGNLQRPNPPVTNQFFSTNQNVLNNSNYSHHIPQTQISSPMPNSQINNNLQGSNPPIRNQYFSSNPYLVNNSNYPHLIHQSRSQTIPISSSQINGRPQASNQPVTNQKVSSNPNVVNNNLLNHIHQSTGPQRGNNAASGQRILISNSQIKSSPQGSNLPVHNQNISSSPSMANSSNYSQHMHQYGFPVSSNPMFDLNSSPRRFADAVSNGTISFQCSPVTPARDKKAQNHNAEIIIREEGSDSVKNKEQNAVNQSTENGTELPHGNSIIQSMDSSSVDVSTMLKENQNHNETKEPTMEQNKTPQQKPKRKKIRPRVVIEGKKPRKTPYSYTKQPHTKENQPAKRKYVRKNAVKTSETPSANVTKEINTDQVVEKSCKKVLFNLDDITIDVSGSNNTDYKEGLLNSIVDSSPSRLTFNGRSEPQAREICTGIKSTPATKSVVQMDQIEEIVVENSPVGLPFDLNCSSFKTLDDIISLPDRPAPTTLPPTRKEQPRENLNILTNNKNILAKTGSAVYQTESDNGKYGNAVRFRSPTNTGLVSQNNSEYVAASEQARGSKRGFCNAVDETSLSMNFIMKHWNILHANHQKFQGNQYQLSSSSVELQNPEAIKKRRTDIDQMAVNSSTPVEHFLEGAREAMACKANNMRANHFASLVKNRGLSPQLGNIIGAKERQSGVINSEPNVHPHVLENQQSCRLQSTFAGLTSQNQKPIWVTRDELQRSQTSMSCVQKEIITKNMSNGPSQISDLTSRSTTANCNPMPKTPLKVPPTAGARLRVENIPRQRDCTKDLTLLDNQVKKTRKRRNTLSSGNSVSQSSINNENLHKNGTLVYKDHQASAKSRGPLELPWQFKFSIDDIIHKLDHLSINDERKNLLMAEKSALVPFRGEAQMVPYEGMFNPIKKRQLRPKVNLDPETDRVWKLLMGIDSSDGVEGTNQDKEKWWEEERKVFRGRADSFIARMHLIQGDRRFTKWKGSVVDSVVGVFLTQNVSDHLSSSAFMSLVARFPHKSANNSRTCHKEQLAVLIEEPDGCVPDSDANINWHENVSKKQVCNQDFISICEVDLEEREKEHSNESFGSNLGGSLADISKGSQINFSEGTELYQQSLENGTETSTPGTRCETLVEVEERITLGGIVSSQQSTVSSQNSVELSKPEQAEGCITARTKYTSSLGEDGRVLEDVVSSQNYVNTSSHGLDERIRQRSHFNSETNHSPKCTSNSSSNPTFAELLQMGGKPTSQEYCSHGSGNFSIYLNSKSGHKQSECMEGEKKRVTTNGADGWKNSFPIYSSNSDFPLTDLCNTHSSSYLLHLAPDSGVQEVNCPEISGAKSGVSLPSNTSDITSIKDLNPIGQRVIQTVETVKPHESSTNTATASMASTYLPSNKYLEHSILNPAKEALLKHQGSSNNFLRAREEKVQHQCALVTEPKDLVGTQAGTGSRPHQVHAQKISSAETINAAKAKGKAEKEKKEFDWDSLRRDAYQKGFKGERNNSTMDSLDWEAVRSADVSELAKAIKERGMNNMLAERIKAFLDRLVKDHGSIDLEWLRDVPPDKAKEYLLSIRGLGLKSVECIRLLTLHHLAFPVDTNVGRIAIRLGWVPLQPLPESLQLHLLEMYPMLDTVQKYLWPRLCKLDQRTLYELHYQLITFGKVFCTKSKPNCNACPMRAECKHFASAFASARLALPGPEEKGIVTSSVPVTVNQNPAMGANPMPFPLLEEGLLWDARLRKNDCKPIIEEPMSPENEYTEIPESDIEDAYYECPNEIPSIDLNIEEFTLNLQNYMEENKIELQEGDVSKALVALTPQAASIPITKLKNVNRLRTEHQVYELPDSHPLLKEVPRREPDDHCSYLLAIWTPGETAESTQPPEICRGSQVAGYLCNEKTCFSCNSVREANSQIVRGTLLIPCRTAMRGSFPLNGTYFQVNEVFADHESSLNPIAVPRASIWNLPRRTVLFGTSVPSIFKGQTTQEIQSCFWKGYVCVRGFDQKSRAPRPLMARLHFPASRVVRNKTSTGNQ